MLHNQFIVTARQSELLRALTEIRNAVWTFLYDDASQIVRGMSRAWNTNNPQILRWTPSNSERLRNSFLFLLMFSAGGRTVCS